MLRALRFAGVLHLDRVLLAGGSVHPFTELFKGFDKNEAVRKIFGDRTEEVLRNLKVELTWVGGYMWVNGGNGHLVVSSRYLNEGDKVDIYLDVIHELVHVRQFMEGKELFDDRYSYVDRPTEIEAYRHTVKEARRIGLKDTEIMKYLDTEWMTNQDLERLTKTLDVKNEYEQTRETKQ
jgi:hypothetical protein